MADFDFNRPINVVGPALASALAMAQADLAKPIVYFTSATISAAEGNGGTKILTLTVRRSTLAGTLNVPAAYVPGTAGAADFANNTLPGDKVFAFVDGSDTATIDIGISGDTDVEDAETFGYRLQSGSGYRLGTPSSVTGTILNDDTGITPLPSGIVAHWDPASLGLANGATVESWTDKAGQAQTAYTSDSTTKHTFVAATGANDLPAVRTSGQAVLRTVDASSPAVLNSWGDATGGRSIIVVARNFQGPGAGMAGAAIAAVGDDGTAILMASQTNTGTFQTLTDCADAGMRTVGFTQRGNATYVNVQGTTLYRYGPAGGHITIGGWRDRGTQLVGRADILAVLVFDHALSIAENMAVHRHFCDRLKQAYPGADNPRAFYLALGDSITHGEAAGGAFGGHPYKIAKALGRPWGTWANLAITGYDWPTIERVQAELVGDIRGLTGRPVVTQMFEFANMKGNPLSSITAGARAVIDKLLALDPQMKIVFGTSTDDGTASAAEKAKRVDYNAYWDNPANRTGIASYVPIHLDPNIGVDGCAPTNRQENAYFSADNLHPNGGGQDVLDAGTYGFRSPISALL